MSDRKSTASADQRLRILNLLRNRPHNCYELRRAGCFQAPTRIFELRHQGFNIETTRVVVIDAEGFTHQGVALYTLHEPSDHWLSVAIPGEEA